ncbi:TRAP transporter small permease [bacterium LRH843]|nr:TRAP transporter small permease [bacterium LRH843]
MNSIVKAIDVVNKWMMLIVSLAFGVMAITIIFQVFSRFFLGLPLPWSEELARLIMAYSVFLGAAIALRQSKLIAVEFLSEKLTDEKRKILHFVIQIIAIVFFIILFVQGIKMIGQVHTQLSSAMRLPMSVFYASIPIGAVLLTMSSIAVIIELFTGKKGEA